MNVPSFTGTRTTEVEVTSTQNNVAYPDAIQSRCSSNQKEGNFVDITTSETQEDTSCKIWSIPRLWYNAIRNHFDSMDRIKLAYAKCALLFACSILITWVPSSANRVNGAVDPSFPLNVAAAAVLPLQGFWNTTIFFWTSWSSIKLEYRHWRQKKAIQRAEKQAESSGQQHNSEERGLPDPSITQLRGPVLETASTSQDSEEEDTRINSAEEFENETINDEEAGVSVQNATSQHATSLRG